MPFSSRMRSLRGRLQGRMARSSPCLLMGVVLLAAACGGAGDDESLGALEHPVLLVGIDGLDPLVVGELIAEGKLPHLAGLAERGVLGELETMDPTLSPVIWNCIATGQPPERHGITFFSDAEGRPFTSNARRVPALWNLVSDGGRSVDVVGWWNTWPAEPIRGRMLASYAAAAQASVIWKSPAAWKELEEQTWPPTLVEELIPHMIFPGDVEVVMNRLHEVFPRPHSSFGEVLRKSQANVAWSLAADQSFAGVGRYMLSNEAADLTMVYMSLPDVAGHGFWSFREPEAFSYEIGAEARQAFGDYVSLSYIEADRLLGELIAAAPKDADVIVLSDHGMHANPAARDDPSQGATGHHLDVPPGILAAAGPRIERRGNLLKGTAERSLGHVLGVAPLVLRLLHIRQPEHWPGVANQAFSLAGCLDLEWSTNNPALTTASVDRDFRAPSASRIPAANLDDEFLNHFSGIGYGVLEEKE